MNHHKYFSDSGSKANCCVLLLIILRPIPKRVEKEAERERGLVSQRKSGLAWTWRNLGKNVLEREKAVALYRYICSFWNMFHIPKTYILNGKFGEQCAEVNCMCSAGPAPISGLQLSVLPWRSRPTDWSSSDINIRRTSRNAAGKTGDSGLLCQKNEKSPI